MSVHKVSENKLAAKRKKKMAAFDFQRRRRDT